MNQEQLAKQILKWIPFENHKDFDEPVYEKSQVVAAIVEALNVGKGPRWVKASDQLPSAGVYNAKYNGDHVIFQVHDGGFRVVFYDGSMDDQPKLNLVKWFDASTPSDVTDTNVGEKISRLTITIDGPVEISDGCHDGYAAVINEMPGMMGAGKTEMEAFEKLMISLKIKVAHDNGIKLPTPQPAIQPSKKIIGDLNERRLAEFKQQFYSYGKSLGLDINSLQRLMWLSKKANNVPTNDRTAEDMESEAIQPSLDEKVKSAMDRFMGDGNWPQASKAEPKPSGEDITNNQYNTPTHR